MEAEFDIDEIVKGFDIDSLEATCAVTTACVSTVKPLTYETLLEVKKLLQQGYKSYHYHTGWEIKMRLLFGYKIRNTQNGIFHISV